jgi:hypothetical protein
MGAETGAVAAGMGGVRLVIGKRSSAQACVVKLVNNSKTVLFK